MITDLVTFINKIQSDTHHIILIINVNEIFNSRHKGVSRLVRFTNPSNHIANHKV